MRLLSRLSMTLALLAMLPFVAVKVLMIAGLSTANAILTTWQE